MLDHHALAAWARVEPYAQFLVWSAMEVGMAVAVPVVALPLAYAATRESDHDILRGLLDLPVTLHDPLTETDAPPNWAASSPTPPTPARWAPTPWPWPASCTPPTRRGWPVLTGNVAALQAPDPDLGTEALL